MNLNATYIRRQTNEDGKVEITFELNSFADAQIINLLEKGSPYQLKITEVKQDRSIRQNHLLWSAIHKISVVRNSELATSEDDWEVYLEALERAQAKFEVIAIKPEAIPMLKQQFRAVKELNRFVTSKGIEMAQCKVFYGSSKMDVQEMGKLIDTVLAMASEEGITDAFNY